MQASSGLLQAMCERWLKTKIFNGVTPVYLIDLGDTTLTKDSNLTSPMQGHTGTYTTLLMQHSY